MASFLNNHRTRISSISKKYGENPFGRHIKIIGAQAFLAGRRPGKAVDMSMNCGLTLHAGVVKNVGSSWDRNHWQ